jgi:hypothetical protein
LNRLALLINLGCSVAAVYFGHAGYPWYRAALLGVISATISIERRTSEPIPISIWIKGWLFIAVSMGAICVALYFAGRLLW